MGMTRRQFVSAAAGAMVPLDRWPIHRSPVAMLLDLKEQCSLRESLAGYESALGDRSMRADARAVPRCAALIVPAALELPPAAIRAIATCLRAGGRVILESGAGFAGEGQFGAHCAVLRDGLQIRVEAPVHLWPRRGPYVDYTWPYPAKLRDFSRVVPLACPTAAGEVIAWADGMPVALKRRRGRGTLIFLGSPLGPTLWAGDVEARRWVSAVVAGRKGAPVRSACS
jgi:hypothetical protein